MQLAEQQHKEEQEGQRRVEAAAKERRRRRAAARAEQQQQAEGDEAAGAAEDDEKRDEEAEEPRQRGRARGGDEQEREQVVGDDRDDERPESSGQDLDLLPDDVLAAIASTKRTVPTSEQQRLITAQLRRQQLRQPVGGAATAKRQRLELAAVERHVDPVTVAVLPSVGDARASEAARAFLQQRLVAGARRSAEMLRPTKVRGPTGTVHVHGPVGWD